MHFHHQHSPCDIDMEILVTAGKGKHIKHSNSLQSPEAVILSLPHPLRREVTSCLLPNYPDFSEFMFLASVEYIIAIFYSVFKSQ